jgi:two-component system, response regulator PdtaR
MMKLVERRSPTTIKPPAGLARSKELEESPRTEGQARILVVEDDFLVSMEIEAALQLAGFEVVGVASSADEAIALAASAQPLLAIVDVRLTGPRDGIDAALAMFKDHGIRSIFATAHSDRHVHARAAPASPLAWLQKPYSMLLLIDTVRHALEQLQARD